MPSREEIARAVAFFEETDDIALLHELLAEAAPRAKRMVGRYLARGDEEAIPGPAELRAAREPATRVEAKNTFESIDDFPLLQVMTRAIGQRIEAMEIAASADFPEGVRVRVPVRPSFPASAPFIEGRVETTGTSLRVLLDNGETWEGPPSLAKLTSDG